MTTTLSSYLTVANNLSKWQSITASSPDVQVATKYFQDNIENVKSASDLINNPRLFNYAMTAFGLGDMTYAKGLMQQVLDQGVTSSRALANTLNNPNVLAFAKAFDFVDNGVATTSSSSLVTQVVNAYTENTLEVNQGQQNPGVQLALYFQQHAPSMTNVYGLLADKNLLTVVQTALGISPMTSAEPIDQQAQMLTSAFKLSDLQDPTKLQKFIARFAAMYDANNNGSGTSSTDSGSTALSLFDSASSATDGIIAIDQTTLLNAANSNFGAL